MDFKCQERRQIPPISSRLLAMNERTEKLSFLYTTKEITQTSQPEVVNATALLTLNKTENTTTSFHPTSYHTKITLRNGTVLSNRTRGNFVMEANIPEELQKVLPVGELKVSWS